MVEFRVLLLATILVAAASETYHRASKDVKFVAVDNLRGRKVVTVELWAGDAKQLTQEKYRQLRDAILIRLKKKTSRNQTTQTPSMTTEAQIHTTTIEATTTPTEATTTTPEPTTTTPEPTTTTPEPTTTTPEPTTTTPEPTTTTPEPTTTTPEPTTTTPEPTTTTPEPTTTTPEPTTTTPEPTTTTPEPTTTTPEPTTTTPEPTTTTPEPTTTTPEPTTTTPEPTTTTPEPTTTTPEPTTTTPEPTTTTPEPTTTPPEPTTTIPEPTTTPPEPTTTTPETTTTTPEPTTTTPEPTTTTTTPEPTTTTPEPTTTTPEPTTTTAMIRRLSDPSPNRRRRRKRSERECNDETEYSEDDVVFADIPNVFTDGVIRTSISLSHEDCEVPEDLLLEVLRDLNSSMELTAIVQMDVKAIYLGLPKDGKGLLFLPIINSHFWLPIVITISFLVVLVILSAVFCFAFRKRRSYAVQESYFPVKGRDNPLTDVEILRDEGKVYANSNGYHSRPIYLTDADGLIIPLSEFHKNENVTNLTNDTAQL